MEIHELGYLCQMILAAAIGWREKQNTLVRDAHASMIAILHEGGEVSLDLVLEEMQSAFGDMNEESRQSRQGYNPAKINSVVQEFLGSEFDDLSAVFSGLFTEFNHRYFAGRLPTYRVAVMHGASRTKVDRKLARTNGQQREIAIAYDGRPEEMVSLLVDTMAHIAAGSDLTTAWRQELTRLYYLGAPTRDRVCELDHTVKWPRERARCCLDEDRFELEFEAQTGKPIRQPRVM